MLTPLLHRGIEGERQGVSVVMDYLVKNWSSYSFVSYWIDNATLQKRLIIEGVSFHIWAERVSTPFPLNPWHVCFQYQQAFILTTAWSYFP